MVAIAVMTNGEGRAFEVVGPGGASEVMERDASGLRDARFFFPFAANGVACGGVSAIVP